MPCFPLLILLTELRSCKIVTKNCMGVAISLTGETIRDSFLCLELFQKELELRQILNRLPERLQFKINNVDMGRMKTNSLQIFLLKVNIHL